MSKRLRLSPSPTARAAIDTLAAAAGCPDSLIAYLALERGIISLMKDVSVILGPLGELHAPSERVRDVLAIVTGSSPMTDH